MFRSDLLQKQSKFPVRLEMPAVVPTSRGLGSSKMESWDREHSFDLRDGKREVSDVVEGIQCCDSNIRARASDVVAITTGCFKQREEGSSATGLRQTWDSCGRQLEQSAQSAERAQKPGKFVFEIHAYNLIKVPANLSHDILPSQSTAESQVPKTCVLNIIFTERRAWRYIQPRCLHPLYNNTPN